MVPSFPKRANIVKVISGTRSPRDGLCWEKKNARTVFAHKKVDDAGIRTHECQAQNPKSTHQAIAVTITGVHSNQDLMWYVKIRVYMGFLGTSWVLINMAPRNSKKMITMGIKRTHLYASSTAPLLSVRWAGQQNVTYHIIPRWFKPLLVPPKLNSMWWCS